MTSTSSPGGKETPSTTAESSTTEQEVIDRYIGYWNARFTANAGTPNPDDPVLREYATGAQLDAVVAETESNRDQGLAFKRADKPHNFQKVTVLELLASHEVVEVTG